MPGHYIWNRVCLFQDMARILPIFAIALPLLTGLTACSTYSVRRAALVPHMTPNTRSGQPVQRTVEGGLGLSTLAQAGAPSEAAKANAGLFIPRTQVNATIRRRVNDRLDVGFTWERGLSKGATKLASDQPDLNNGDVSGGGVSVYYSAPMRNPNFSIGLSTDLMAYSIPYVEFRTCVENCLEGTDITHGRSTQPVASLGITPSYKKDQWTFFGGLTAKNHPTIEKGSVDNGVLFSDDEVSAGNFNVVANAGAELDLGGGFRGMVHVYQTLSADPVDYKPTLGIGLTLPLSSD